MKNLTNYEDLEDDGYGSERFLVGKLGEMDESKKSLKSQQRRTAPNSSPNRLYPSFSYPSIIPISMASSSTSSIHKSFTYDVLLSFGGKDNRTNFIDHLYHALLDRNIRTYKDDEEINKGNRINDELMESIEASKYFIIVFSKNYASSSWCLDELVKIMDCHKTTKHTAYPVFYDVEPTKVRKQSREVGEAFARHEKEEAVGKWRKALKEAADLAGWELKNTAGGHEAKCIRQIVEKVSLELRSINVHIDKNLVGMEIRVNDILSSLETASDDVRMIGIKGIGGGGKTTLARAVFNKISYQFEGKSFVDKVREASNASSSGLKLLQSQILSNVLNNHGINVGSVSEGKNMMSWMIGGRKSLIVLDDVDHVEQLEALAGDPSWFKPGSIIIITTRDEHVLIAHGVKLIHNVNLLSEEEAIWLFSRHAFGKEIPIEGYEELSRQVVCYAAGLPLTIKVLGSFLCGKNKLEWKEALARLETIPLKETQKVLELSYTGLDDDYKEIFLDVATILKGWSKHSTIEALESCGFHPRIGLRVLEQKSLITIGNDECVGMHDHFEELGRNIVRRLHPDMPNKHSRLWDRKEIEDILANDMGTEATRCIRFYRGRLNQEIFMKGLRKMKELQFLDAEALELNQGINKLIPNFLDALAFLCCSWKFDEVSPYFPDALRYLRWNRYPFRSLPGTFQANNLVALQLDFSNIVQLWEGGERKVLNKLRFLQLSGPELRTFDLGLTPNLEKLTLGGHGDLVELCMPDECSKLRFLKLYGSKLTTLNLGLTPNLEELDLNIDLVELYMPLECSKLRSLEIRSSKLRTLDLGLIPNLEKLDLNSDLVELYMSVECSKLRSLKFTGSKLTTLDLGLTPNLEKLRLRGHGDLVELYMPAECLNLRSVKLYGSKLRTLDLRMTPILEKLDLNSDLVELYMPVECSNLRSLQLEGSNIRMLDLGLTPSLEKLDLNKCYNLGEIHVPNECLKLKDLKLSGSKLRTLDLGHAPNLEKLSLLSCDNLVELHTSQRCLNFKYIYLHSINLRTLDIGMTLNLNSLELTRCNYLEEFHMPCSSLNLTYLRVIESNLRTLDIGLTPYLNWLELINCHYLEEFHITDECQNLKYLVVHRSKLRTLDLGLTPNLRKLVFKECYNLVEIHAPIGYLENVFYIDLSGCFGFRSFVFHKKDNSSAKLSDSVEVRPLTELHFTLERCPFHPDKDLPKFESTCIHKEDLPSLTRSLEKLFSQGLCACTKLETILRSIPKAFVS
ncbi:unnamed protein product [Lactuca saligna]|uniref:TIR domain-containing protein n=1 Tax=Lactuca saligna TaxID=75948 RepID=A0AA36A408_LACSI|nr:unnamed protein product [Lactuca saligna]